MAEAGIVGADDELMAEGISVLKLEVVVGCSRRHDGQ
jgi:hypothetical protein